MRSVQNANPYPPVNLTLRHQLDIQMAEDRASVAAMVEMKTEKLLVLCVNRIWRERRFSVRGRRKSDEIGISEFLRDLCE